MDYEEALILEARIDEALSGQMQAVVRPLSTSAQEKGNPKGKESSSNIGRRVEGAKVVREIWADIYERWKVLVACKDERERLHGLERFDCGTFVLPNIDLFLACYVRVCLNKDRRKC